MYRSDEYDGPVIEFLLKQLGEDRRDEHYYKSAPNSFVSYFFSRARALGARSLLRAVYNRYIISVSRIVVRVKEQETSACMIRR